MSRTATAIALALVLCAGSRHAAADVDPIVLHMLRNLRAVDEIAEAIALEQFDQAERAAAALQSGDAAIQKDTSARLAADARAEFERFLAEQREGAAAIRAAAREQNPSAAWSGLERVLNRACVGCHQRFRSGDESVRAPVLFMMTFLNAWRDINRGALIGDLGLVSSRARELMSLSNVLAWDQVAEAMFSVPKPADRKAFRSYVKQLMDEAAVIERAAADGAVPEIIAAAGRMWREGCVSCHERFREQR